MPEQCLAALPRWTFLLPATPLVLTGQNMDILPADHTKFIHSSAVEGLKYEKYGKGNLWGLR
jgi:hypothetical protein